ncbi:hypothetical protein Tco_1134046 [Tanacetum coccineum]
MSDGEHFATDAELAWSRSGKRGCLLPQIREQGSRGTATGAVNWVSNPPPVTIPDWLDRFNKQETTFCSRKAVACDVCEELYLPYGRRSANMIGFTEYMQRFLRLAGFLGQAAGMRRAQGDELLLGLHKSILDHVMCIQFTDVAQVADAARNLEILRDRDDYDRSERSDKRHKSGDRYQSATQQISYRGHDQKNDRQGSDSRAGWWNSGAGRDQRNRGYPTVQGLPSEG